MEYKHLILGLSFVLIGVSEAYSTEMHPSHEVHVHGQAVLNIVLDGSTLFIEFESPVINLIGFEHAPVNEEQKSKLQNAKQTLAATEQLFYFSTATCRSENVEIEVPYTNQHEDRKLPHRGEHVDFHASYTFKCEPVKDLQEITIKLFSLFPAIRQIKTYWISHGIQAATVLESSNPILKIN